MRSTSLFYAAGAALAVSLVIASTGCKKEAATPAAPAAPAADKEKVAEPRKEAAPSCPATYKDLAADAQALEYACMCSANATGGAVWGSGIYTTDSSICAAAVHAGAITKETGGEVKVKAAGGCAEYMGTDAGGVTSSRWGAFGTSFYFPAKGDGKCYEPPKGGCPKKYTDLAADVQATEYTCTCQPGSTVGPVWGTSIYTTDSSICAAGLHAGAITDAGGPVTIKAAPGCSRYQGTTAAGVSSGNWGPFNASFYFVGKGDGACLKAPDGACPDSYKGLSAEQQTAEATCTCEPNQAAAPVWGTGVFTTDSSICTAAVLAGAITLGEGGSVTVKRAPGCQKYVGSSASGVTSGAWGPYDASFFFPAKGDGTCASIAADACPGTYNTLSAEQQAGEHSCSCAADQISGSVWGSGIYTADSSICNAAMHSGAIMREGGNVTVKRAAGCQKYMGTTANGVTTGPWGAYATSFVFPGKGEAACAPVDASACPASYNSLSPEQQAGELTCTCAADQMSGAVWGSGAYTVDSSICNAALHAGAATAEGGSVTVKKAPGCAKYVGTAANGVTTGDWGSYDTSFFFPAKGDGTCAK